MELLHDVPLHIIISQWQRYLYCQELYPRKLHCVDHIWTQQQRPGARELYPLLWHRASRLHRPRSIGPSFKREAVQGPSPEGLGHRHLHQLIRRGMLSIMEGIFHKCLSLLG